MDFDPNEDFDFGAAPPLDASDNEPELDEKYDTFNDETFGGEVGDVPKDFSTFAASSLAVELETARLDDIDTTKPGSSTENINAFLSQQQQFDKPSSSFGAPGQHLTNSAPGFPSPPQIPHGQQVPPTGFPFVPPPSGMPPLNPMYVQQMWAQYQRVTLAHMAANNVPPENISPLLQSPVPPPFFVAYLMQHNAMNPPPGFNPSGPPSMMNQPPSTRQENGTPMDPRMFSQGTFQGSCPSPGSTTSKRNRKEGMPSIRTISDYAFDPFAGFMSKKEREWLIKIQLIQCLGTGDKYVDDYYYTMWKQSNELEQLPADWKQPKIKSKYYNLEETYPSHYTPPSFSGALGKPSNATTSYPRQCFKLLDLHPNEDDDESVVGGPSRDNKRKLRNILLNIENAYLLLLECDDFKRKLDTEPQLADEIKLKIQSIYNIVLDETHIPTTMVVGKGRRLLVRVLPFASGPLVIQILSNVFNTLRKYSKKVSNSDYREFIEAALQAFTSVGINDLRLFFENTHADRFKDTLVYSSFSQSLVTTLLLSCARKNIQFDDGFDKTSIVQFIISERRMFSGLGNNFNDIFSHEDLIVFKHWLSSSKLRTPGNFLDNLLISVSTKLQEFTMFYGRN